MKIRPDSSWRFVFSCLALSLILAIPTLAGPPLICHPISIGSAQSLPWPNDGGNLVGRSDYDVSHLVADTLSLLTPEMPVLVRMETLRRATIYAQRDQQVAKELLLRLNARTTANARDALASFDFGYLVECYKQAQLAYSQGLRAWGNRNWSNPAANIGERCGRRAPARFGDGVLGCADRLRTITQGVSAAYRPGRCWC